jgi:hypothetical protein
LPKIKLKLLPADYPAEEVFELDQAKSRLNFEGGLILVDGLRVQSYEELVRLVAGREYRDREVIEVVGIMPIAGG